jgi:hypothetical protein
LGYTDGLGFSGAASGTKRNMLRTSITLPITSRDDFKSRGTWPKTAPEEPYDNGVTEGTRSATQGNLASNLWRNRSKSGLHQGLLIAVLLAKKLVLVSQGSKALGDLVIPVEPHGRLLGLLAAETAHCTGTCIETHSQQHPDEPSFTPQLPKQAALKPVSNVQLVQARGCDEPNGLQPKFECD